MLATNSIAAIGADVTTGLTLSVPLRHAERPVHLTITGGFCTGKTTLATQLTEHATEHGWHAEHIDAETFPDLERTEHTLLVVDNAEHAFQHAPERWVEFACRAQLYDITIITITYSLLPQAFGNSEILRNVLLSGSVIRLHTNNETERAHERRVDLSRLDRHGHGYVQTPEMDDPAEFRFPLETHAAAAVYLQHTCPACASDGGYGTAEADQLYQCPSCRVVWRPAPDLSPVKTRFGHWIQRAKVAMTS